MSNALPTVTRHDNGDDTYRYAIDALPGFELKASKALYTHASIFGDSQQPIVQFHKTEGAAMRATYKYAPKVGVVTIEAA